MSIKPGTKARPRNRKIGDRQDVLSVPYFPTRRTDIHPLDRAIAELRAELARKPDDSTLLGRLAALYYRRGDFGDAEKHYRRAIALSPRRPTLFNNLANVLCDMGRMRDGIAAYEQAIALEKENGRTPSAEAVVNLELARIESRLIQERIDFLERAAQLEVSSPEAQNTLGCGYLLRGNFQAAQQAFHKAAEMDSRNTAAALNVAFVRTLCLSAGDELKEALAEIAEAVLRFPKEPRLHIHQGELLENAGMLEGAEERYLRAAQADPRCLEAYDLLGRLREATGMGRTRDDTVRIVERVLEKLEQGGGGFDAAFVQIARARFERRPLPAPGKLDRQLREAAREPGGAAAQAAILRAQLLESDGRREEARVVLENASQALPQSARLWFERGTHALRAGDVDEAVANFDRATLAAPQDAVAYHSLRFAFEGYRRYRAERVRFEAASRANPRDGLPHHHIGLAALSVLKNEEALFHFTRALELDPRLSDAACGRGRALQRLGHIEEAEAAYAKALDIDPENGEAQRSLIGVRSQKLLAPAAK